MRGKVLRGILEACYFKGGEALKFLNFLKVELTNLDFRSLLFQGRRDTDNPGVIILVLLFT